MKQSGKLIFRKKMTNRNDRLDFPYEIVGHKLRWLSARTTEDRQGRIWRVLRKSDLPVEVVADLASQAINVFKDGDTIRNGTLVLGYASNEAAAEAKSYVDAETRSQLQSIGVQSGKHPGVRYDPKETGVERVGSSEFEK